MKMSEIHKYYGGLVHAGTGPLYFKQITNLKVPALYLKYNSFPDCYDKEVEERKGEYMFKREEFERVTPESVGIGSKDIEWLLDRLESGFTEPHGLMIMRHGKICAEGWWNPYAPGIRHGEQSHSKTYAATAVGIAYTEGLLSLDERIIDIFPEEAPLEPTENLCKLTVRDVLCMGCGMDEMPKPSQDWIRDFLHTPVTHVPGSAFMYNSVGSSLLGAIVRKKSGMGLHAYLKPRLYDKIGIFADNHRWMHMPDGMEVGGGGLYATTEDNLRLMKLYADGGVWNGEVILAPEYVEQATSLQNDSATEALNNPPAKDNFVGYGYQIWMCRPQGVYRADGAMGQFTIVAPNQDMIIAITENASGAHWAQTTLDTMWEFLDRVTANPAEKEDEEAAGHLKRRMERLALPCPVYAPFQPVQEKIAGRIYCVKSGYFTLSDAGVGHMMAAALLPEGISRFSFAFFSDSCVFTYQASKEQEQAVIALDGSRRWNKLKGAVAEQALMSGAWIGEKQFEITIRRIETCAEEKMVFAFEGDEVTISVTGNVIFGNNYGRIVAQAE